MPADPIGDIRRPILIIFGGLPGVGKTTIARVLAGQIGAVHLRIDSIEQALRESRVVPGPLDDSGYRVAYAVAGDNLQVGRTVIADSVNPLVLTRRAWLQVAERARVPAVEFEIKCSNAEEHRHRVETRAGDIPMVSWNDVATREYHSWDNEHFIIDTFGRTLEQTLAQIQECLLRVALPPP